MSISTRRVWLSISFLIWFATATRAQDATCACGEEMACYEREHFRVRQISFETLFGDKTPLSFIFAVRQMLLKQSAALKSQLPLKEGEEFNSASYGASQEKLGGL